MKLLFDQNLSPFLASRLADIFPESVHVQHVGLDRAGDAAVWDYAGANGFLRYPQTYRRVESSHLGRV